MLYAIFIVALLLFGSLYIGPVTPRQLMAIVMFVVCWRNNALQIDKYFKTYIVFIIGYLIAQIFTGYVAELIRLLFGYYFVSFVAYQSTKLLIRKEENANLLMWILLFLGLVDGLVTVGQMYQVPFTHEISMLLGNSTLSDIYDVMSLRSQDSMLGYTVPGLLGPVPNGYFLAAITLLCFYNSKAKLTTINIVLVSFFVYATFLVQERTALAACVFLSLVCLYKILFSHGEVSVFKKVVAIVVILVAFVYYLPDFYSTVMEGDSRYAMGYSLSEERGDITRNALEYLFTHPIGGINEFSTLYHYPHNLFINAFMYGGLLGGIALIVLLLKQVILLSKISLEKVSPNNIQRFIFAMMFACYTINSLTHNLSIVTGEPTFWIFWGAIIGLQTNKRVQDQKQ